MSRLSAAENLVIEMENGLWRLFLRDELGEHKMLVEAVEGQPLRYNRRFARSRRLPPEGVLPRQAIRQVILGWSNEDESWHLGLLLVSDLANQRGSRWCEIASWPDPDRNVFLEHARRAGDALAQTLGLSFGFIEPKVRPAQVEPPPLPELPVYCGMWTLERGNGVLQFRRNRRWITSRIVRIIWYVLLTVTYIVLALTTLNTDLALPNAGTMLPNPELLPYLGLLVALILVGSILYYVYEILTEPNRIVIDPQQRVVVALRGDNVRWQHTADSLQSVYVTQVVSKRGRNRSLYHGELNLHLQDGQFHKLLQNDDEQDLDNVDTSSPAQEYVDVLDRHTLNTDLQIAGVYIAEALGNLPCWYDQRTR